MSRHLLFTRASWLLVLAWLLCPAWSVAQPAVTLEELLQEGRLQIETTLIPAEPAVPTQQVELVIEIATDRWFAAGTRIGLFEVEGALLLRRNSFATNLTRRIRGQTWTVQLWTMHLHPQRNGEIQVPAINLDITVAGDDGRPVVGRVQTNPVTLSVSTPGDLAPPGASAKTGWVATDSFLVEEKFSRSLENLKPGDAVTHTVSFEANNLPALLLPTLSHTTIDGLGVYPQQPKFSDSNNRGVVTGRRIEAVTYVLEKPGSFVLPQQEFVWWHTGFRERRIVVLPEFKLETIDYVAPVESEVSSPVPERVDWTSMATAAVVFVLLLFLLVRRRSQALREAEAPVQPVSLAQLERQFAAHCRRDDPQQAIAVLYRWLDYSGSQPDTIGFRQRLEVSGETQLVRDFDVLLSRVYSGEPATARISPIPLRRLRKSLANKRVVSSDFSLN